MITKMVHDVYGSRKVTNEDGSEVNEPYLIKENVSSKFFINEFDIRAAMPKRNEKGNLYRKRIIVITEGDSYVIEETFDHLMDLIEKGRPGAVGFKTNGRTGKD